MLPHTDSETAPQIYAAIMEEVKIRLRAGEDFLQNAWLVRQPKGFVQLECCALQVRMVCELTALALLIAHHDVNGVQRLRRQSDPRLLMEEISRLEHAAYPRRLETRGPREFAVVGSPLTREDIANIYGLCGNLLHRGSFRRGAEGLRNRLDPHILGEWLTTFRHLLQQHEIEFRELGRSYWIFLGSDREEVKFVTTAHVKLG